MAKKSKQSKSNKTHKHRVIIALIVVVLVLAGGIGWHIHKDNSKKTVTVTSVAKRPVNSISYSPSTPSDNAPNNARKGNSSSQSNSTLNSPSKTPQFSVTISRANGDSQSSSITTAANVNGISDGTCVFNFAQSLNGQSVVSSTPEQVELSNQSAECPPITQTMPSSGNWYVSVSVTSGTSIQKAEWIANPVKL